MSESKRVLMWRVRVEAEVVVVADSQFTAEMKAADVASSEYGDGDFDGFAVEVTDINQLPQPWTAIELPWVDEGSAPDADEMTCGEWLEHIAAVPLTEQELEAAGQLTLDETVTP